MPNLTFDGAPMDRFPVASFLSRRAGLAAAVNGDENLARETGARLLIVNPAFTVDHHFGLIPFQRAEDIAFMAGHLRAAGLP